MPVAPSPMDVLPESLKPEAGKAERTQLLTAFLIVAHTPPETFEDTDQMTDDRARQARKAAERPEMRIVSRAGEELATDALSITDYQNWGCNDYNIVPTMELDAPMVSYTDRNYVILSPRDLVLVMPRDRRDHVEWLVERARYEEALKEAEEIEAQERMSVVKTDEDPKTKMHLTAQEIGQKYVEHLVSEGASFVVLSRVFWSSERFLQATSSRQPNYARRSAPMTLSAGKTGYLFSHNKDSFRCAAVLLDSQYESLRFCQAIIPFVPTDNPRLDHVVYEMILAHFLIHDRTVSNLSLLPDNWTDVHPDPFTNRQRMAS
jgi:hypothetical protein